MAALARRSPRAWLGRRLLSVLGWLVAIVALGWIAIHAGHRDRGSPFYASITSRDKSAVTSAGPIALSPDGMHLAMIINRAGALMISVYDFSSGNTTALESTKGAGFPFWSPDSRWIGFFADEKLKKVEMGGGPAQTLADAHAGRGGSWDRAGVIVFAPDIRGPIMKVSENGGAASPVTKPATEEITHRNPVFLPDGKRFLFIERKSRSEAVGRLVAGSLDGSTSREILDRASNAQFADGRLLFVRDGSLLAQRFDPKSLTLAGTIVPVAENIAYYNPRDIGDFSASPAGLLAFLHEATVESTPAWFDRNGRLIEPLAAPGFFFGVGNSASRDLREMAVVRSEPGKQTADIWVMNTATKQMQRATFVNAPLGLLSCAFSPDGRSLAVTSGNAGPAGWASSALWVQPVLGAGQGRTLLESTDFQVYDWSPDGDVLLGHCQRTGTGMDITFVRLDDPKHEIHDLIKTQFAEVGPKFSPDGRSILYCSDESGRYEIYLADFPERDGQAASLQ
jgi:eukaryotic-like serine/threonine-protein kinase